VAHDDYIEWPHTNIDGHSMKDQGGDCLGCNFTSCHAKCEALKSEGCIAFVTDADAEDEVCYMRKLNAADHGSCELPMRANPLFTTYTANRSCTFAPGWRPGATNSSITNQATFAIPVPFFPLANSSRVRIEYTSHTALETSPMDSNSISASTSVLKLLLNGTEVSATSLSPALPAAELRYQKEKGKAEVGWNTWLSGDMLTHALLPHGLALQMVLKSADGNTAVSMLGNNGPKCDRALFPATHGLHDRRGEYTEIESVDLAQSQYRVETATDQIDEGRLQIIVTCLKGKNTTVGAADVLTITAGVPDAWKPRRCNVHSSTAIVATAAPAAAASVVADCPGLPDVTLMPSTDSSGVEEVNGIEATATGFTVPLPSAVGATVAFTAVLAGGGGGPPAPSSTAAIRAIVSARRAALMARFAAYASASVATSTSNHSSGPAPHANRNETVAGLVTAISWNVIYTPYEGIFTPVFRGSPWSVSKPHNYGAPS
jgi:hypothetical protein